MSTLSLKLPQSLYEQVRTLAKREGVSVNQFIAMAVAEKAEALIAEEYLAERAKRGSREDLLVILEKVPDVEPEPHDKL